MAGAVLITGAFRGIGAGKVLGVATAIVWHMGPQASYTTSTLLDVAGGR